MWLFLLLSCRLFYYEDERVSQLEVSKVVNNWNIGIQRSYASSLKVLVMDANQQMGHGSGNLFNYYGEYFVITAAHVVDANLDYLLQENDGNTVACRLIYKDTGNDVAILKPYGEFTVTQSSPYLVNMQKDLVAKEVYYAGNPGELNHVAIRGWIAESDHRSIIIQSFGWPGSSGSVVFDSAGRVIGVVSAIPLVPNFYDGGMLPMSQLVLVKRLEVIPRKTVREALMNEKRRIESWNSPDR
jgi:S1-C subfamily serine protease